MEDEESVREIGREIYCAVDLIRAEHVGGNSEGAVGLLLEAAKALKTDNFKEALNFAKRAQAEAKPNTEYLLSNAKGFASKAEKSFDAEKYEDSISLWRKAAEEYFAARKVAEEREEQEIVESIGQVKKKINENIEKAEAAIDSREMLRFVSEGNSAVENADRLFEDDKFDEAKKIYENAKSAFKAAQKLAEKRDFEAGRKKIADALKSIDPSIEATLLSKGHFLLNEAKVAFETKEFAETDKLLERTLLFLEGLKIRSEELEDMKLQGRERLLMAKLELGKEKMGSADILIGNDRYYEAKEAYKGARGYLENLQDEASKFGFSEIVKKLENLCDVCSRNISESTNALVDVSGVKPKIVPVNEVKTATVGSRGTKGNRIRKSSGSEISAEVESVSGKTAGANELTAPERKIPEKLDYIIPPSKPGTKRAFQSPFPEELAAKYKDIEYIGRGGFARVFKSRRHDEKFVAVKIPSSSDAATGKSFISELMNWTGLEHENIVRVHDFNILPIPYFEMELCDCALSEKQFPLDANSSAWIIFNICEGLKYAHSKSIIHQDLKPQNILLNDGIPKISDWGLSKVATTSGTSSLGGYTPLYAAPEQISKKFGKRDPRTDIWQVGAIFYEIVTGKTPFEGDDPVMIMSGITMEDPEPPSSINPEAEMLDPIIMKCLEKKQDKRYQSVSEFQKDIAEFLRIDYTESLRVSVSQNDLRKSAFYCGDLLIVHLKLGDLGTAHKYARDLLQYAQGDIGDTTNELCKQLKVRIDNGIDNVPNELMRKAEFIAHNLGLGFRKINSPENAKKEVNAREVKARKLPESVEDQKSI